MDYLKLFNVAILIALIIFSGWHFWLRFMSDRVATIKDLLLAYVTGGALAVASMVFGVSGDIIDDTKAIRQDTVSIRTTLSEGIPSTGKPAAISVEEELAELLAVNRQQTQALRKVLSTLTDLQKTSGKPNQPTPVNEELAKLLEVNQQQTQILRRLSGTTESLVEKIDLNNRLISRILETSGSSQGFPAELSGSQFSMRLDLVCSLPRIAVTRLAPTCAIRPADAQGINP